MRRKIGALDRAWLHGLVVMRQPITVSELEELQNLCVDLTLAEDDSLGMEELRDLARGLLVRRAYPQVIGDVLAGLMSSLRASCWDVDAWPVEEVGGPSPLPQQLDQAVDACVGVCTTMLAADGEVEPQAWRLLDQAVQGCGAWFYTLVPLRATLRDWTSAMEEAQTRFVEGCAALFPNWYPTVLSKLSGRARERPDDGELRGLIEELRAAFAGGRDDCLLWTGRFRELEQLVERAADCRGRPGDIGAARRAWALLQQLGSCRRPTFSVDLSRRRARLRSAMISGGPRASAPARRP